MAAAGDRSWFIWSGFRAWAGLWALAWAASVAGATDLGWHRITAEPVSYLTVDHGGRLWGIDQAFGVRMWPDAAATDDSTAGVPHRYRTPGGTRPTNFFVTADDRLYVCTWSDYALTPGLFVGAVADTGAGAWRRIELPGMYGRIMAIIEDDEGRIWIGGERRETFRLEPGGWRTHMIPQPLHVQDLLRDDAGGLWALASAHRDNAVLRWDGSAWRTLNISESWHDTEFLRVLGDTLVMGLDGRLVRWCRYGNDVPRTWVESETKLLAPASLDSVWACRDGRLELWCGAGWEDRGPMPLLPSRLVWIEGRLYAYGQGGLWVMESTSVASSSAPPLGLAPAHDKGIPGESSVYGLAVLDLPSGPHLYLTRHTRPDVVAPLGPGRSSEAWRRASSSLGLNKLDESYRWAESYEMAVAVGDLDGDDHEDVVLATMYDGPRLLRCLDGRRFMPWTDQAGLRGMEKDTSEDVDLLDADGDGDLDLYVCALQGADRFFVNNGAAVFTDATGVAGLVTPDASTSAIARDLDADGDTDIVVSTSGRGLYLHENVTSPGGAPSFRTRILLADTPHPELPGGLSDYQLTGIEAVDLDGDGDTDLLVGARSQPLLFLRHDGDLAFVRDTSPFAGEAPRGVLGITAMDPDGDGDWDLACTGGGGSRFLESRGGRLHPVQTAGGMSAAAATHRSTGSVLVDLDGDGDLDYIEAFVNSNPIVYVNTNGLRSLHVRVRGPLGNVGAVGATVTVSVAGSTQPVAMQEIAGGSGYASHRTRRLAFGGLDPDGRYDVTATLPGGATATVRDVRGRGHVMVDMRPGGLAGRVDLLAHRARVAWTDRWGRAEILTTVATMLVVLAAGLGRRQRYPGAVPWLAAAGLLTVGAACRRLLPPDPGLDHVAITTLAGLGGGLLVLSVARPRPPARMVSLLAEFSASLRSFDHNRTPRKVIDGIRFVRGNADAARQGGAPVAALLREDLELFGGVVLPEFTFIVEGARSVEFDTRPGERRLRAMTRRYRRLATMADAELASSRGLGMVDRLLAAVDEFHQWVADLQRQVDQRLTTPLPAFMDRWVHSRGSVHQVRLDAEAAPVSVRMAEPELARVLDSLVENAVRAAAPQPARVSVRAEETASGRVRLEIRDEGPGIPEHVAESAFEAGVTATPEGTGYGLFAVRRTVERYGGRAYLGDGGDGGGALIILELDIVNNIGAPS